MAIPTGRTPQVAAFLIPGVNLSNVDVGGTNIINTTGGSLSIHGGSIGDTRLLIDGVTIANTEGTGWSANMLPNMGSTQEVAVDYSSATRREHHRRPADQHDPEDRRQPVFAARCSPPRVNSSFEGTQHRRRPASRAACARPNSLKHQSDINPGLRRPARSATSCGSTPRPGSRGRRTTSAACSRTRTPATSPSGPTSRTRTSRAFNDATEQSVNLRLTWQADARTTS